MLQKHASVISLERTAREQASNEITDYRIYSRLSRIDGKSSSKVKRIFSDLAGMELKHYEFWIKYCKGAKPKPNRLKILLVVFLRWVIGASFAIKYLEGQEASTAKRYEYFEMLVPPEDREAFEAIIVDEKTHERTFAEEVKGSYVKYISFIVLGLADALVEIAGIHAGSLGIYESTELTGLAGIVAGAAASIAMASAAFAQAKQGFQGSASVAAIYTGISYFVNAVILATPYFITRDMFTAITTSVAFGVVIIGFISWYNSVMSESSFKKDFAELAGIMLGATLALYLFGSLVRLLFGIAV